MLSRSGDPRYHATSLDRAAKLTGEAFGFEEAGDAVAPHSLASKSLWIMAGLAALFGLAYLAMR